MSLEDFKEMRLMGMKRTAPRISVNKLGNYIGANATRQRSIIADQRESKPFTAARYKEATNAILKYLGDGTQDTRIIEAAIKKLRSKVPTTTFQKQERILNIEALESFLQIAKQLDLRSHSRKIIYQSPQSIEIAGVKISVDLYIVFATNGRNGDTKLGIVTLHFPKGHHLDKETAPYVGAVLLKHCDLTHGRSGTPDHRLFRIVDVPTRRIFPAPKHTKKRFMEIEAACQEIARGWNDQ